VSTLGLAEEVLALHAAILRVLIVENRAGEIRIVGQAGKNGHQFLDAASEREKENLVFGPAMILGAASQVGNANSAGELKLVGMLYEQRAAVCIPIDADTYLMVTTANENFLEVMNTLQHSLPDILRKRYLRPEHLAVNSAIDVDQTMRTFFANARLCEPNNVHMEDATLNTSGQTWQVSGSYRPTHAVRSKRYYIEIDAKTGAVTKFQART